MTNHPKHGEAMWETLIDGHDVIVETAVTGTTVATNVRKRKDTSRTAKFDAKNPSKNSLVATYTTDAAAKAQHDSTVNAVQAGLHPHE